MDIYLAPSTGGTIRSHTTFYSKNMAGRLTWIDLSLDGSVISKLTLNKYDVRVWNEIQLAQDMV